MFFGAGVQVSWNILDQFEEDRRPKLLETGAVGGVQGTKRDQQESVIA